MSHAGQVCSGGLLVLHLDLDEGLSSLRPRLNGDRIREPGEILLQSGRKPGIFLSSHKGRERGAFLVRIVSLESIS